MEAVQVEQQETGTSAAAYAMSDLDRPAVLVVDDDTDVRKLVGLVLKDHAVVLEASNAEEAIRKLDIATVPGSAIQRIRAVLVDIMMPGMDGIALCRRIRREFNIPVIMLTARSSPADVEAAVRNGASDYIVKPFDYRLLVDKVSKHLG